MSFVVTMWIALGTLAVLGLLIGAYYGLSRSLVVTNENAEVIKIALVVIAAVYTAGVFHVETLDKRIANTLAFQHKTETGHLRAAFDAIDMFWIRGEGTNILKEYRALEKRKPGSEQVHDANDAWARQATEFARTKGHEDEIVAIYRFYRDIVVCVEQGRCHKKTACQLFADNIENFRLTYSEFLADWEDLWNHHAIQTLMYFYDDCAGLRAIGGRRSGQRGPSIQVEP